MKKLDPKKLRKRDAGSRRAAHFAAGGTPATWRGRAVTLDQAHSKAQQNKRACRGRVHPDEEEVR